MRRRTLLPTLPPTVIGLSAGCIGDVSRRTSKWESSVDRIEFNQTSRTQSFCDNACSFIDRGRCTEDERPLTTVAKSEGSSDAITLLGVVRTNDTDTHALRTEQLTDEERDVIDGVNFDAASRMMQGSYPQTRATLEVQFVGANAKQPYVSTRSLMEDADEPELVSTLVRVQEAIVPDALVIGNELVKKGEEPLGHAIFN